MSLRRSSFYKRKMQFKVPQTLIIHEKERYFSGVTNEKQQTDSHTILVDTLLNIERKGVFPDDDPCPYLGVRKPMETSHYSNNYSEFSCKPHRPAYKDCALAQEIYGSAGELPTQRCEEPKFEDICEFQVNETAREYQLECDWSICNKEKVSVGEMSSIHGEVMHWQLAPNNTEVEEIIHRSIENGFNFIFFKCEGLSQVLMLPRPIRLYKNEMKSPKINVNIVLIDSISRPHFYRSMPKTIKAFRDVVYNKSIPATILDFEQFQSVSQHTMDNCRPLYSGVTSGVYEEFSSEWRKSVKPLGIHVLFGEYKHSGYQTLFQEEGCWYDYWGLMLTDVERFPTPKDSEGFIKRWSELQERWKKYYIDDFGMTHFTCEVTKKYGRTNDLEKPAQVCFNGDFISTYFLRYHLDYLEALKRQEGSLPFLHYLHLVTGHTSSGKRIRNDDVGLANYVTHLANEPNTLTIILSDHGHTRTAFAKSVEGRFELSNPLMFMILPENVAKILQNDKVHSLVENQRRLFTTLDIHLMLMSLNNPVKYSSDNYRINGILSILPSNRTCENLPLTPLTRCKCDGWDQKVQDNSQRHMWLAEFAVGKLNNIIQDQFMKGKTYGGYGSCLRLRGLGTKNNIEKQMDNKIWTTMDLLVQSAVPGLVDVFQVLIEIPLLPDKKNSSAKMIRFDRHTLYNRYQHCVDEAVDIRLCTCASKHSEDVPTARAKLRGMATRNMFGAKTEIKKLDKNCLQLLSRRHNYSIAYEVVNYCDNSYTFKVDGTAFNMLLTAKLPLNMTVMPRALYFLFSATRYVVNDSFLDIKTTYKLLE
ncbi:uncharacterized protein LOC124448376 isoform X2 [Xenia sp. Carnegie-2017]|nr:uncharacterized protein LOC124448376 isoform X2 [Xenia sp. Carnegie-2017]